MRISAAQLDIARWLQLREGGFFSQPTEVQAAQRPRGRDPCSRVGLVAGGNRSQHGWDQKTSPPHSCRICQCLLHFRHAFRPRHTPLQAPRKRGDTTRDEPGRQLNPRPNLRPDARPAHVGCFSLRRLLRGIGGAGAATADLPSLTDRPWKRGCYGKRVP